MFYITNNYQGRFFQNRRDQEFLDGVESLLATIATGNLYNRFRSSACCNAMSNFPVDLQVRKDMARKFRCHFRDRYVIANM